MLWNYLKLAVRNLTKQGLRTLINIFGLGFGIAVCLLIYMFATMELSFNQFHENKDQIYRVYNSFARVNGDRAFSPFQPYELASAISESVAAVEMSCGLRSNPAWIGEGDKLFNEQIGFTDSTYLEMFSFPVIAGDKVNPLAEPQSVVLTRTVAIKFFGDSIKDMEKIIGEVIGFPQPPPNQFTITAVLEDPPLNNSFRWTVLIPYQNAMYYPQCNDPWGNTSIYVFLNPESDPLEVEKTLQSLKEEHHGERIGQMVHFGSLADVEDNFKYCLQPLPDLYLHSDGFGGCYETLSNMRIIRILSSIALLILLIACFNYVMLTIGASMNRLRDLGMMNVFGARKGQILSHFITESFILTLIALFLGIILAEQILPLFNNLAEEDLTFILYDRWENLIFLLIILAFIVFSTSLYVGIFLLRKNQPVKFLRKELLSLKRHRFARYFVILQYLITIILMICSGVIIKQLHYMMDQDVGFETEDVVVLPVDFQLQKVKTLKDKLLQQSHIQNISMSDRNFVSGSSSTGEKNAQGEIVTIRFLRIDHDYLETFGLKLLDGRNFTPNEPIENNFNVIVNETFARQYNLDSPVGEVITLKSFDVDVTIIGVVRDFHFDSMHDEIQSVMLIIFPFNSIWSVFVKIDNTDIQAALKQIETAWNEVVPEYTFDYHFLSDMLEEQYNNEDRWSRITAYSAAIAIFLSCLGLLGISGLLVARRVKEVGIRKANGASVAKVLLLLNGDILKWVLVSFIFACPIAWYIMNRWLQDFAIRTNISWWIYALSGLAATAIALLTITWQTYRAASKNPVNALRYE